MPAPVAGRECTSNGAPPAWPAAPRIAQARPTIIPRLSRSAATPIRASPDRSRTRRQPEPARPRPESTFGASARVDAERPSQNPCAGTRGTGRPSTSAHGIPAVRRDAARSGSRQECGRAPAAGRDVAVEPLEPIQPWRIVGAAPPRQAPLPAHASRVPRAPPTSLRRSRRDERRPDQVIDGARQQLRRHAPALAAPAPAGTRSPRAARR